MLLTSKKSSLARKTKRAVFLSSRSIMTRSVVRSKSKATTSTRVLYIVPMWQFNALPVAISFFYLAKRNSDETLLLIVSVVVELCGILVIHFVQLPTVPGNFDGLTHMATNWALLKFANPSSGRFLEERTVSTMFVCPYSLAVLYEA